MTTSVDEMGAMPCCGNMPHERHEPGCDKDKPLEYVVKFVGGETATLKSSKGIEVTGTGHDPLIWIKFELTTGEMAYFNPDHVVAIHQEKL